MGLSKLQVTMVPLTLLSYLSFAIILHNLYYQLREQKKKEKIKKKQIAHSSMTG